MNIKKLFYIFSLACSLLPATAFAGYSYSTDGAEVTDSATGLVWRRCVEGMAWRGNTCTSIATTFTHDGALARAKSEATISAKAWRVPNLNELSSIIQRALSVSPSIDSVAFPATPSGYFWSSSPYVGDSGFAWGVNFGYGFAGYDFRGYYSYVRLVR